ncbi:MAG: hypothetical protein AAFP83_04740 [Bacteroidota bacterium]
MNMKTKGIILLVLALGTLSCRNEEDPRITVFAYDWEVNSLKAEGNSEVISGGPYLLQFNNDTTLELLLDINACDMYFEFDSTQQVNWKGGGACTLVCCDSDFATQIYPALLTTMRFELTNRTLRFEGPDSFVEMERGRMR